MCTLGFNTQQYQQLKKTTINKGKKTSKNKQQKQLHEKVAPECTHKKEKLI